jgi:hypothetical protein
MSASSADDNPNSPTWIASYPTELSIVARCCDRFWSRRNFTPLRRGRWGSR